MKLCKVEVSKGKVTCLACGIPFEGPFAISHEEMVAIGSDLTKIRRPCGHTSVPRAVRTAEILALPARQSSPPAPKVNYAGCVHRGEEARLEECPSCNGTVQIKVFPCAVHGECQLARKIAGIQVCDRTCPEFSLS